MNNLLYFNFLPEELNNIVVSYLSYRDFDHLLNINFDLKTVSYIRFPYLHRLRNKQGVTYELNSDEYLNWLRLSDNKNHPDIDQYITTGKLDASTIYFHIKNMEYIDMFDAYNVFLVFFDILDNIYSKINEKLKSHGINLNRKHLNIFNLLLFVVSNYGYDASYFTHYLSNNKDFNINDMDYTAMDGPYIISDIKDTITRILNHEQLDDLKEVARSLAKYLFSLLLMLIYEDWIKSGRDVDDEVLRFYQKYMHKK